MVTLGANESKFQEQLRDVSHRLQHAYPRSYKRVTDALEGKDQSTSNTGLSVSRIRDEQKAYFYPVLQSSTNGDQYLSIDSVDATVIKLLQKNRDVPQQRDLVQQLLSRSSPLRTKLAGLDHSQIKISADFVSKHPLYNFIAKPLPLVEEDFISLMESGFIDLQLLRKTDDTKVSCGVLEASCGPSHGDDVWTRDMAAVALGKLDIGQAQFAEKIAFKLYEAYAGKPQRERINNLLRDPNIWDTSTDSNLNIPHTKFSVQEITDAGGKKDYILENCKQSWGMQQLDAYGYFLQLLAKLAIEHDEDINTWDTKIQTSNDENRNFYYQEGNIEKPKKTESTMVALANMLCKIEYWKRRDFGAWEDPMHEQRASSIAACISGLKWVYKYFEQKGNFETAPIAVDNGQDLNLGEFKKHLETAIQEGEKTLFELRLPKIEDAANKNAIEIKEGGEDYDRNGRYHKNRHKDAALLLILMLSDPNMIGDRGLSEDQHFSILRTVYELMGDIGFKRFPTDEYMGMNWTTKKHKGTNHKEHADNTAQNYKPAEWCFFDPYLATYFYKRFIKSITNEMGELDKSKTPDLESYLIADRHARRSLAMISKANYCFFRKGHDAGWGRSNDDAYIDIPAGEAMEHYWYNDNNLHSGEPNTEKGQWMPGENYRLNWTKIALQQMFFSGCNASKLFKEILPNGWDQQPITGLDMSIAIKRGAFPTISNLQQRIESIAETLKKQIALRAKARKKT